MNEKNRRSGSLETLPVVFIFIFTLKHRERQAQASDGRPRISPASYQIPAALLNTPDRKYLLAFSS